MDSARIRGTGGQLKQYLLSNVIKWPGLPSGPMVSVYFLQVTDIIKILSGEIISQVSDVTPSQLSSCYRTCSGGASGWQNLGIDLSFEWTVSGDQTKET